MMIVRYVFFGNICLPLCMRIIYSYGISVKFIWNFTTVDRHQPRPTILLIIPTYSQSYCLSYFPKLSCLPLISQMTVTLNIGPTANRSPSPTDCSLYISNISCSFHLRQSRSLDFAFLMFLLLFSLLYSIFLCKMK